MGIKNLFKKKKLDVEQPVEHKVVTVSCEHCGINIESWDKGTTFDNKKYHVKCFRKLKKQAAKMAFSP